MIYKGILFITFYIVSFVTLVNAQTDTIPSGMGKDTSDTQFNIPIFSTAGGDVDNDLEQQDVSALLMSSRDAFTQFASFHFSAARYRVRGYMAENQMVMVNGVNMNNLETGFSSWSSWGGLNDVTRFVETRFGITPCRLNFSSAGGYTNIESKASSFKKGTRFSYANANRIFRHRMMLTHSTGLLENGWALTLSGSMRYGNEVYIPGTFFHAGAYYVSIDKRINDIHLLSFTGFGAPIRQGRNSASTKELYQLTGNNYYNALWGYQNGKVRNSNVSSNHRPVLMLTHHYNLGIATKLTSTIYYMFGKSGLTGLNWNDAPNPRPDFYRNFPSFYYLRGDTAMGDMYKNMWINNTNGIQQLNWDKMIQMNMNNLYTPPNELGQGINTTQTRARYILEDRVENLKMLGINSVYNSRINDVWFISAGVNAQIYRNRKYKVAEDLLGADFWLDVDQFAEGIAVDPIFAANDINNPYKTVKQGEEFGYNYFININRAEAWGMAEASWDKADFYFGLQLSDQQVWRDGKMVNGKFPQTSGGKSEVLNFFNYGLKGGVVLKLSGRHFVTLNGLFGTRAPEANNIFLSQRVRNDILPNVGNEEVLSGDINYLLKAPNTKVRLTGYYTSFKNQLWLRSFWSDEFNNMVNYFLTGLNQIHTGVEIGVEQKLFIKHTLQAVFGYGQFYYSNRPSATAVQDNNNTKLFENRTVYWKNYYVGGMPQMIAGLGYRYNGKKFWFAGINFNYAGEIYIDPNPDRRTYESVQKYYLNEPQGYEPILKQEKLPNYFYINANAGKSFRIQRKYYLSFNFSVNNLLNNKNIITGGFESLRWDVNAVEKFPNRYFYMTGLTYMGIVNFNF